MLHFLRSKFYLAYNVRFASVGFDISRIIYEACPVSSLSWFAFLQAGAGEPNPRETGDGANFGGEPPSRSLSGPSPSANLVGIWKGDPLVPACAGHHGLPNETRHVLAR
jgi:hypothetical protein